MCKITLIGEDRACKTCIITENETPYQILKHYHINPTTTIVYMNGAILSEKQLKEPITKTGNIYISVRTKTVIRD